MSQTMENYLLVRCINTGATKKIIKGKTLAEACVEFKVKLDNPILGAIVNNVLEDLSFELYHPKIVKFIDITHPDGYRMYTRSLSFVLVKAVYDLYPNALLRIKHSISKGIYCEVNNMKIADKDQLLADIKTKMQEIINADIPFKFIEEETEEVIKKFENLGFLDKKELLIDSGENYTEYYQLGKQINSFFGCLVPSTGYLTTFDINPYYNGFLMRLPKKKDPSLLEPLVVQDKLYEIFREHSDWNKILDVPNVNDLNFACENGRSERLIKVSEALQEKKIGQIADAITDRSLNIKIVLISGPSSSGKTTFAKRLAVHLMVNGKKPLNISLDNYFLDRDNTPLDENGDHDYEAIEAIDIDTFNQNLISLLKGEKIGLPKFSFENGTRYYNGEFMQLLPENILIIEGIHALNPKITEVLLAEQMFKIYVSALTSINLDNHNRISTTDNRLIRRIIRDYRYRHNTPAATIARWQSVISGEGKHIFPYQEEANVMFNSAHIYELAVLKPFLEPILQEIHPNQTEYSEAVRLLKFMSYIKPLKIKEVPPTSILREFLGGSSFTY